MSIGSFPQLREELALYRGAKTDNGSPVWVIHDPARNRYFQIEWAVFEVLSRCRLGDYKKIAAQINHETVLQISEEFVGHVANFLRTQQLVRVSGAAALAELSHAAEAKRQSGFSWLIHHYLFFRVPIVRPDRFLSHTLPLVNWLYSKTVLVLLILALTIGVALLSRQWDVFKTSLLDLFTMQGLFYFIIALGISKVSHELGHAYTAKRYGCKVPVMGVAFLVMWPMLYTDTNDTWKLQSRRQRLAVGAAGMTVELAIATVSTLLWTFLPPGSLRDMTFVLATTTWVSSLLINLSPFMRFDGYYLMSDWMNIPNLHDRAFKRARWWLREFLFDLGEPAPEYFPPARARLLTCFAFAVWIYRLVLFLGIAVVVYHFFVKIIGILLFLIEIGWFIARPIKNELGEWMKRRRSIAGRRRSWVSLMVFAALLSVGIVPWQSRITAQALLEASNHQTLYAVNAGRLASVPTVEGQEIKQGDAVFNFENPDLTAQVRALAPQKKALTASLQAAAYDQELRDRKDSILADLVHLEAHQKSLEQELLKLTITAPISGVLVDIDPTLREGQWISKGQRLAAVRSEAGVSITTYVNEDDIFRIMQGSDCHFYSKASNRLSSACKVESIEPAATGLIEKPAFASVFGGSIPVRATDAGLVPERAVYKVRISVTDQTLSPPSQVSGYVTIEAEQRSFYDRAWKWGASVLIREAGM